MLGCTFPLVAEAYAWGFATPLALWLIHKVRSFFN